MGNQTVFLSLSPIVKSYLSVAEALGIIGSCISLRYIILKLKVSVHIKRALIAEAIFILIGSVLSAIGLFNIVWNEVTNSVTCGLMIDWIPVNCSTIGNKTQNNTFLAEYMKCLSKVS